MKKTFVKAEPACLSGDDGSNSSPCITSSSPSASDTDFGVARDFKDLSCSDHGLEPYLSILHQPQAMFRFRYVSEMSGTHGCLLAQHQNGRNKQRAYPSVELENYRKKAIIRCQLWHHEQDEEHPHRIQSGDSTEGVLYVEGSVGPEKFAPLSFPEMGIIYTGKKSVVEELFRRHYKLGLDEASEKKLRLRCTSKASAANLNIVRLKFTAHNPTDRSLICPPVFSTPIYNMKSAETNELKICRMDKLVGSAKGQDDIFILTEKVNKKNISIRFVEEDETGVEVWSKEAFFTQADVHHQYAIVFKTPPYRDPETPVDVCVWVELFRPSDGSTSERKRFKYKADPRHASKKRKFHGSGSELSSSESTVSLKSTDIPRFITNMIAQQTEHLIDEPFVDLALPPSQVTSTRQYMSQLRPPAAAEAGLDSALYLDRIRGEPTLSPPLQMPTPASGQTNTYSGTATFVPSTNPSSEFNWTELFTQGVVENSDDFRNALLNLSSDPYRDYVMQVDEQVEQSFSEINYKHLNPMKTDAAKKVTPAGIGKRQMATPRDKKTPESTMRVQPLRDVTYDSIGDLCESVKPQMDTEGFIVSPRSPLGIWNRVQTQKDTSDVLVYQSAEPEITDTKMVFTTRPQSGERGRIEAQMCEEVVKPQERIDAPPIEGSSKETQNAIPTSDISRLTSNVAEDDSPATTIQHTHTKTTRHSYSPEIRDSESMLVVQADDGGDSESVPTRIESQEPIKREPYTAKYGKDDGALVNKESDDDALTDSDIPDVDMEAYIADLVTKYCKILKNKELCNTALGMRHLGEILQNIMVPRLSNGDTFLHMLVANQSTSMLDYMVRQMRRLNLRGLLDIPNAAGETVLHLSVLHQLPAVTSCLLSAGCSLTQDDSAGRTALHVAALQTEADCLRRLLLYLKMHPEYSVDPRDNEGMTPCLLAARYGIAGNMALLLEGGAAADARDASARHALHLVAAGDHLRAAQLVLRRLPPGEIDCVDGAGNTALQMVCSGGARTHTLALAKLLCDHGANVTKRSGGNSCPLQLASDNPQLLELLRRYAFGDVDVKSEPEDEFDSAQDDTDEDDSFKEVTNFNVIPASADI